MAGKPNIDYDALAADIMATREYHDAVQKIADVLAKARANSDPSGLTRATSRVALDRARNLAETAAKSLAQDLTKAALKKIGETAAKSLAQDLAKAELKKIGETIAQGLAEGKRPVDLYNKLQEIKSLDSNRAKTYDNLKKKLEKSGLSPDAQKKLLDKEYCEQLRSWHRFSKI